MAFIYVIVCMDWRWDYSGTPGLGRIHFRCL